jgi:hypothetical protein
MAALHGDRPLDVSDLDGDQHIWRKVKGAPGTPKGSGCGEAA